MDHAGYSWIIRPDADGWSWALRRKGDGRTVMTGRADTRAIAAACVIRSMMVGVGEPAPAQSLAA